MSFAERRADTKAAKAGAKAIKALPLDARQVVFYAESAADWAFLGPVFDEFSKSVDSVIRVTSDPDDPVLSEPRSFYIGSGIPRTVYFKTAEAAMFVMTLTDLDTMQLKRSVHPVHYAYVFHSIASTHRIYRDRAFDAYDTVLCVGPHQVRELRMLEELHGIAPRPLLEHGYARLDVLLRAIGDGGVEGDRGPEPQAGGCRVLVAPSWGPTSLVEYSFEEMIESLVADGHAVTVRLHPMTRRHQPDLEERLVAKFAGTGRFRFDPNIAATASFVEADTLITEWSGAALDYAFARLRPVVSIDTPPKINNPNHAEVPMVPFEDAVRTRIGRVVDLDDIAQVGSICRQLADEADEWQEAIRIVRDEAVFNIGDSARTGARHLVDTYRTLAVPPRG
jgi:YidC/Oxa1 family membrane protein insertase